ncbi:T9SS type A sorting domain-containing protein [candidate division KSB1 bacterium]|nr:T9SS type A sorting domain-containing protein [candidate division KSB1 bacterium]
MKKILVGALVTLFLCPLIVYAQNFTLYNTDNSELPYNQVYCIGFDNNNNIWFGGQRDAATGIAQVSQLSRDLTTWTVYDQAALGLGDLEDRVFYLAVDDQNTKWLCTHYGVSYVRADGSTGVVEFTRDQYARTVWTDTKGNVYISQREDSRADARIWVSPDHGANWTGWTLADIDIALSPDDARPEIYDLREDSKGQLWICTWFGVTYRDLEGVWHSIKAIEGNYTHAMTIDPDDHVWVADLIYDEPPLANKLLEILPDGSIVEHDSTTIEPLKYAVMDLESDYRGHIWCALYGGGLLEIRPDGSFEQYTAASTEGALPEDILTHMEIHNNVIWASTESVGIVRLSTLINETYVGVFADDFSAAVPEELMLYNNYPNPFNPSTLINFDLKSQGDIQLSIYNVKGELVRNLAKGVYRAGSYSVIWDGCDSKGDIMPSGIYIYMLHTGNRLESRKMTLIK